MFQMDSQNLKISDKDHSMFKVTQPLDLNEKSHLA